MLFNLPCMKSVFLFCHEWVGNFGTFVHILKSWASNEDVVSQSELNFRFYPAKVFLKNMYIYINAGVESTLA